MSIQPFSPRKLPNIPIKWDRLIESIAAAHSMTARVDEAIQSVKRPKKVFSILRTREAIWSMESQRSKHVHPTLEEILIYEASGFYSEDKERRIKEILVNRNALDWAASKTSKGPISCTLLRQIHHLLKKDAAVAKCDIGHFRNRQNWIGPIGCSMEDAYFYPPPAHVVRGAMANWEKYVHAKQKDPLVQLAIVFAQLLIVHPFMDGNGRISRLLIPLFLAKKGVVEKPLFYMSRYFQKHRLKFLENLHKTSMENRWEEWICFFLAGMIQEGNELLKSMKKIRSLHEEISEKLPDSENLVEMLFEHPVISGTALGKHKDKLSASGLKPYFQHERNCYIFKPLLKIGSR